MKIVWMLYLVQLWLILACCIGASLPYMATSSRYLEKNHDHKFSDSVPLKVRVMSWNMAEKVPTEESCDFIKNFRSDDIIVFGVQECEHIRPRRNEGHRSRKWRQIQSKLLGSAFRCIARHKMGGLLIAVYAKRSVSREIEGLQIADVACGVGNVLTNKGAVSVVLRIRGRTLAFINSHLAAHQQHVSSFLL